ncbi:MAG: ABC transporter permease [Cyanobacteria bacterium NC_groundwater_1444_Ag_S-0.65um_54_12]|nr:ABC transporter permease [Cyanobacteria bacterium NC_groundwater_1444_Ag_S-0.65um_54_12]
MKAGWWDEAKRWSQFLGRLARPGGPPEYSLLFLHFRCICFETILPVLLVAVFIGATATLMGFHAFRALGTETLVGSYAGLVCLRELAPLLASAMVAAKPGTSLTATLAVMRSTEQIAALEVIGTDPYRYLLLPRIIAFVMATPLLVIFADAAALGASFAMAVQQLSVTPEVFWREVARFVAPHDLGIGMLKGAVFAALTGLIATYYGFNAQSGPRGVSRAVTRAMVAMAIADVLANYLISEAFYGQ